MTILIHQVDKYASSYGSVSMRISRVDRPGLHCAATKQRVEYCSKQVDGSSNVEDSLPFLYCVLNDREHSELVLTFLIMHLNEEELATIRQYQNLHYW